MSAGKPLWDDAGEAWESWRDVVHLTPADDGVVPQYPVQLPDGWALTQGRDNSTGSNATDDLILSKFGPAGGRPLETRTVARGGHGDRAYVVDGRLVVQVKGSWSSVTFGTAWKIRPTDTPARCSLRAGAGCQGEAYAGGGQWLRLYGESIKGGAERDPSHRTAFLQVIDGTKVVRKISLDDVARDAKGDPIGGRYEPEGVSIGVVDGVRCVLVGFSVGRLGNTTMQVYALPLDRVV